MRREYFELPRDDDWRTDRRPRLIRQDFYVALDYYLRMTVSRGGLRNKLRSKRRQLWGSAETARAVVAKNWHISPATVKRKAREHHNGCIARMSEVVEMGRTLEDELDHIEARATFYRKYSFKREMGRA